MRNRPESGMAIVAEAAGITNAEIIAGRLQAAGIAARALWREGAGGEGFGITVGNLGAAYVVVPSELEEAAKEILSQEYEADDDDESDIGYEEELV